MTSSCDRVPAARSSATIAPDYLTRRGSVTSSPGRDAYVKAREKGPLELWISSSSAVFPDLPWELLKDPDRPAPLALELAA